jgi:hypothetical protein
MAERNPWQKLRYAQSSVRSRENVCEQSTADFTKLQEEEVDVDADRASEIEVSCAFPFECHCPIKYLAGATP